MNLIISAEGTPYLFGGIDPFHGGADCSGLIYWAGLQCGVTLPRTTEAEWAALPHFSNWSAAPLASIIEFDVPADGGSPPQHVGIVVGGGYMIDDPHTGTVVKKEAIPNVPGVITPLGYCTLPFVVIPNQPTPTPPISEEDYIVSDSTTAQNGDNIAHAVGAPGTPIAGHYLEITRKAGSQGLPAVDGLSIIDITDAYPQFIVAA